MTSKKENYLKAAEVNASIPGVDRFKLELTDISFKLKNSILGILNKILYKKPYQPQKILIFRTGSLGDSINAIPAIKSIVASFPGAQTDILTNAGSKHLIGLKYLIDQSLYNEIIDYNGVNKKELFELLKEKKYDMVIQLPQVDAPFLSILRDLLIFRRIAPSGLGWFVSQSKWFRKIQAAYLVFPNEHTRLLSYLKSKDFVIDEVSPSININDSDIKYVKGLMLANNIQVQDKKICIVVGAKRPQNRWPIAYFEEVAKYFSRRCKILLIGSGEDQILAQSLLTIDNVISFCGKLTPLQSAAMLSFSDLTLSNDTGPMHLSYAVNTPTIALFSSRDLPGKWYPPKKNNYVFRTEGVKCQACFSETCNNNICMKAILPAEIIALIKKIL